MKKEKNEQKDNHGQLKSIHAYELWKHNIQKLKSFTRQRLITLGQIAIQLIRYLDIFYVYKYIKIPFKVYSIKKSI